MATEPARRAITAEKRCAISFFYDPDGIVDDYMVYLLRAMRPHCGHILFVVNGKLDAASRAKIAECTDEIIVRSNEGFDVWAYKTGIAQIWAHHAGAFDEVLMFNHTFYGPIFPLVEMFDAMAERDCDFWGMTAHRACVEHTASGPREIPYHLNSHFIAVREPMLSSDSFVSYWEKMPAIRSYDESINVHEIPFTRHFEAKGFKSSVYVDPDLFGTDYPAFAELDETILRARSPILKRRAFFHDPMYMDERAIDLPRALALIEEHSEYDTSLIWRNIVRSTPSRVLYANAARIRILPDIPLDELPARSPRIALCVHAYYAELIEEILDYAENIPFLFDLIVTTNTDDKRDLIEAAAAKRSGIGRVIVRLWTERGRDMSALFVACADLFADDRYDLVCRLHTKRSPQVSASLGNFFKRFVVENTIGGRGYVERIVDLFTRHPDLGMAMPPMIHISTPTLGHAWFVNRQRTVELAKGLDITVPIDGNSPIAAYGGMFWFRPAALRKLFQAGFTYEDFEPEPLPVDGALPHALERLLVFACHDAGYSNLQVGLPRLIEQSYAMLEYKAEELAGRLPTGNFRRQVQVLDRARDVLHAAMVSSDFAVPSREALDESMRLTDRATRAEARERHLLARLLQADSSKRPSPVVEKIADLAGMSSAFKAEVRTVERYLAKVEQLSGGTYRAPARRDIVNYVRRGYLERHELFPLFDSEFYMDSNPDILGIGINPMVHFLRHGWAEGRSPHPLINVRYVRANQPHMFLASGVPLEDILARKADRLTSFHPLFDPRHYLSQIGEELGERYPFEHYLASGALRRINPHPLFDEAYYQEHTLDLQQTHLTGLVHFIRIGALRGDRPSPRFDAASYLRRNPDVLAQRINPLEHFVQFGRKEGRQPL